jgi:hypothetical protein
MHCYAVAGTCSGEHPDCWNIAIRCSGVSEASDTKTVHATTIRTKIKAYGREGLAQQPSSTHRFEFVNSPHRHVVSLFMRDV